VLLAYSADGGDKLPLLVIGKYKTHIASKMSRVYLQNMKLIQVLGCPPKYLKITSHN
jgi:hypothetical protein